MADSKISALPASTTPLAGTEVLPIVQSSTTKQVSVANLTAGRDIAATSLTTAAVQATNSGGLALKNSGGTTQILLGGGGGDNITLSVATNITPANAAVAISPTGTGTVTINPNTASSMNNVAIGGTTPLAGGFTTVKAATTMGVGAATPAASGAGITFPVSQSASSDANTLDDYEEGTWSPTLKGDGGGADQTYSVQAGYYTKIGNQVTATFRVILTAAGTPSGSAILGGLPFAVKNAVGTGAGNISNYANLGTALASLTIFPVENTSFCYFYGVVLAATSQTGLSPSVWSNTTILIGSVTYFV
jgi:hypothetical protein